MRTLQPPRHRNATGLGSSEFARHYYRNRGFFLFLQVLRWFTSLSSLMPAYEFSGMFPGFAREGFPIRRSPVVTPVCGLPKLIAACHVLHRLSLPRHPPCALSSLTIELTPAQEAESLQSCSKLTYIIRLERNSLCSRTHRVTTPKDTLLTLNTLPEPSHDDSLLVLGLVLRHPDTYPFQLPCGGRYEGEEPDAHYPINFVVKDPRLVELSRRPRPEAVETCRTN